MTLSTFVEPSHGTRRLRGMIWIPAALSDAAALSSVTLTYTHSRYHYHYLSLPLRHLSNLIPAASSFGFHCGAHRPIPQATVVCCCALCTSHVDLVQQRAQPASLSLPSSPSQHLSTNTTRCQPPVGWPTGSRLSSYPPRSYRSGSTFSSLDPIPQLCRLSDYPSQHPFQ